MIELLNLLVDLYVIFADAFVGVCELFEYTLFDFVVNFLFEKYTSRLFNNMSILSLKYLSDSAINAKIANIYNNLPLHDIEENNITGIWGVFAIRLNRINVLKYVIDLPQHDPDNLISYFNYIISEGNGSHKHILKYLYTFIHVRRNIYLNDLHKCNNIQLLDYLITLITTYRANDKKPIFQLVNFEIPISRELKNLYATMFVPLITNDSFNVAKYIYDKCIGRRRMLDRKLREYIVTRIYSDTLTGYLHKCKIASFAKSIGVDLSKVIIRVPNDLKCKNYNFEFIKYLIREHRVQISDKRFIPITNELNNENMDYVRYMLKVPSAMNLIINRIPTLYKYPSMVNLLIKRGIDNTKLIGPLQRTVENILFKLRLEKIIHPHLVGDILRY